MLVNSNTGKYLTHRLELHGYRSKHVNLLIMIDGENRQCTLIKKSSILHNSLNAIHKGAYHFSINCLHCFHAALATEKYYENCSNGHVKVKIPSDKEEWLKLHDGQYQFKVPFILYTDFENIFKPVNVQHREKSNRMKT